MSSIQRQLSGDGPGRMNTVAGSGIVPGDPDDPAIQAVAACALALVVNGTRLGLGSGRAASAFITQLGAKVRQGLSIAAVPTSAASAQLARHAGIHLIDLDEDYELDLTVDGADEVAPNLDLLKGRGGAMVRERIVASASKRQIILIGREKLVRVLGERGPLPVEVMPFAVGPAARRLRALGLVPAIRTESGSGLTNENGNLTLDCPIPVPAGPGSNPYDLEASILAIPGVVDTGFFRGTAERVLVGFPDGSVETLVRGKA